VFFPKLGRGHSNIQKGKRKTPCCKSADQVGHMPGRAANMLEWEVSTGKKYYPVLDVLPDDPLKHNNLHKKHAIKWGR
jgi:hypothetical protein